MLLAIPYIVKSLTKILLWSHMYIVSFFRKINSKSITKNELLNRVGCLDLYEPIVFLYDSIFTKGEHPLIYSRADMYRDLYTSINNNIRFITPSISSLGGWRERAIETIIRIKTSYPQWNIDHQIHFIACDRTSNIMSGIHLILKNPKSYSIGSACFRKICDRNRTALGRKYKRMIKLSDGGKVLFSDILDNLFTNTVTFEIYSESENIIHDDSLIKSITLISDTTHHQSYLLSPLHFIRDYLSSVLIRLYVYMLPSPLKYLWDLEMDEEDLNIKSFIDCFSLSSPILSPDYHLKEQDSLSEKIYYLKMSDRDNDESDLICHANRFRRGIVYHSVEVTDLKRVILYHIRFLCSLSRNN